MTLLGGIGMKMSKNYKRLCLVLGLSTVIGTGALAAKSGTETKQATYRNIQVTYNGAAQSLALEPFLIDGSVYVPLRAFGDIVGVNATWAPASNTVILTGGSSNSTAEAQIAQLTYQNTLLQRQLEEANAKLSKYESGSTSSGSGTTSGTNITAAQLKDTENYLNENFSDYLNSKIDFNFELSQTASRLNLTISYSSKSENRVFGDISQRNIEKFIEKVCDNVAATHKDIEIQGTIEYTGDDVEKVSFTRNKSAKYSYNFAFDTEILTELISDETNDVFTLGTIGQRKVSEIDVAIRETKSIVNAKLYLSMSADDLTAWNGLTPTQKKNAVKVQLEDIQDVLFDRTGYDIDVMIYADATHMIAEITADGELIYS